MSKTCGKKMGAALSALVLISEPALAQDTADLRDDQLLRSIVQATEVGEASDLLDFMQEASRRGLLMFEGEQTCEPGVPETGLMANEFKRGTVRWAYVMRVWELAMDRGDCGCPYALQSFADFQQELVGHNGDITEADIDVFDEFWQERKRVIDPAYRAFKEERCGD